MDKPTNEHDVQLQRINLAYKMVDAVISEGTAYEELLPIDQAAYDFLRREFGWKEEVVTREDVSVALAQSMDRELKILQLEAEAFREIRSAFSTHGDKNVLAFGSRVREILQEMRQVELKLSKE